MYEEDRLLAEQCERLARETVNASEWLVHNKEMVGLALEGHEKALRKAGRLMRNCAVAAKRKMCAGVFGPSQAGKSYLVSTLAGNAESKLWTRIGDKTYDFLSEINPAGGKESTGLVTRFTLTNPVQSPAGYPVHVRLLSLIDVVKILANTYYSDAEHMDTPDREAMLTVLRELEKRKAPSPTGGLTQDDVEDLQEYIHKNFRGKARVQQLLDQHFWDRIIPLAPFLDDTDRAELFGLIWDSLPPFTNLLRELFRSLRTLDFSPEAFCPVEALIPRDKSIIDVATLGTLSPDADDSLELATPGGAKARLPRVYITALTAELIISMQDKPADFFEHTDLLDFPGYRSRKMFVDLAKEAEDPAKLKECFLRGKVAYLFERYCAERELTSLLLCIGSGVQEVQGLGGAVNDWITGTHGGTPERRLGKENALFFILTKSDLEFEDKAGAKDVSERWDTRMYASLELFTSYEWLQNWDGKGPFRNFFLMRNPTVKLHLFGHDANGNESSLKEDSRPYVDQFEKAFMQSPLINERFAYKAETWKAFMTPNDGGLSLIREKLAPICKPELKRAQITTTVEEQLSQIRTRLQNYLKKDDKEELRKEKALLARDFAKVFLGMVKSGQFGIFSRLLTVKDQDVYDLYFQAQHQMQEELSQSPSGFGTAAVPKSSVDDMLADLLGQDSFEEEPASIAQDASETPPQSDDSGPRDEEQAFADHILKFWIGRLSLLEEDPVLPAHFNFPPELLPRFRQELEIGFLRLKFRQELENALRKASRYVNMEKERLVWKQASIAVAIINSFADWLGFDPKTADDGRRTITVGNKQRTLFSPPAEISGLPPLREDPVDYTASVAMDWVAALMHLVEENANFDGEQGFDPEQNNRLKTILTALHVQGAYA